MGRLTAWLTGAPGSEVCRRFSDLADLAGYARRHGLAVVRFTDPDTGEWISPK